MVQVAVVLLVCSVYLSQALSALAMQNLPLYAMYMSLYHSCVAREKAKEKNETTGAR